MKPILTLLIAAILAIGSLNAAKPKDVVVEIENDDPEVIVALKTDLSTPQVPEKQREAVREAMRQVAVDLVHAGFEVETLREGEVIISIVPTDMLFLPNETTLLPSASQRLDKFRQYISSAGRYKIVLSAHSDNTGSEEYLLDLTEGRLMSILEYYENHGLNVDEIVGYPVADFDPLVENDTRAHRARNRRIEVYILPGQPMIDSAKTKRK